MRTPSRAVRLALITAALTGALLVLLQASGLTSPEELASLGRDGDGADLVVEDFGLDDVPDKQPFDGQYLYVTARLLPDWSAIDDQLQEASFRLVRILHPLLASPGGRGVPVLALMQAWNVVGLGLLTWGLADVLGRHGHRPEWAIAAAPACVIPLLVTTSEPLAFGLGMAGLALADRGQIGLAIVPLALGGLTRDSALTFAVAAAATLWMGRRGRAAAVLLAAAVAPTAAWWAYVQSVTSASRTPLGLLGIVNLFDQWSWDIIGSLLTIALIGISVVAWWDVLPLRCAAVAFAAWLPIYEGIAFRVVGIPRISLPSIALGLAGLARWTARDDVGTSALVASSHDQRPLR